MAGITITLTDAYERSAWERGFRLVAGVDEAGRGPLAGPVVAAAVVLPSLSPSPGVAVIPGLNDSKKLSAGRREYLYEQITRVALAVGVGIISPVLIDEINILAATYRAMVEAVHNLSVSPDYLLIDGKDTIPGVTTPQQAIVKGDSRSPSIAAASIIAKVTRDRIMVELDREFPQYGFARHKGYGTADHIRAILTYGRSVVHRKTFKVYGL